MSAGSRGSDFEYDHRVVMSDDSAKYAHLVAHATRAQQSQRGLNPASPPPAILEPTSIFPYVRVVDETGWKP